MQKSFLGSLVLMVFFISIFPISVFAQGAPRTSYSSTQSLTDGAIDAAGAVMSTAQIADSASAVPAAGPGAPVAVAADVPAAKAEVTKVVKEKLWLKVLGAIATALINVGTYAADKLAYDAAVFVSSGGNGGDPLFDNRSITKYSSDFAAGVAGEALGSFDESGILGNFKLCSPNADLNLAFKFGIKGIFDKPEPKCDFNDIKTNWTGFLAKISTTATTPFAANGLILTSLADAFNPDTNDLSVGIQLTSSVLSKAQNDAALEAQKNLLTNGFQDKTGIITGKVLTPAELIAKEYWYQKDDPQRWRDATAVAALTNKDVLLQIGVHAASVFVNTALSKITSSTFTGLFKNLSATTADPFSSVNFSSTNTVAAAQAAFKSWLISTPLSVSDFSLLGDFGACPSDNRGLYNCVMDSSFISAVSRADAGGAVTVSEAIEQGLLNGGWPLISSGDKARNQDPFCYTYGYCEGNLVKMRKARIISTGWELAAESINNNVYSPITLEEVVDAFNDCNDQGILDENHPWCHLIDPDWILKYPTSQCKAEVNGQQLVSSASDERTQECVDMPSCISEDSSGNCTGGYGYCVREANTWEFRGETCPDYYGSCMAYTDVNGDEKDYIANTTDSGNCNADNAGCLWYQTTKTVADDGTAEWPDYTTQASLTSVEAGGSGTDAEALYRNRMYFTSVVATCSADDAGCKELVSREDGNVLNMVANSSFEEDTNADGVPDGWFATGTGATYATDSSTSLNSTSAITTVSGTSNGYYQPGIVLTQGTEYTFSFYAKPGSSTATPTASLKFKGSDEVAIDMTGYLTQGCTVGTSHDELLVTFAAGSTDYTRATCTFTAPVLGASSTELAVSLYLTASSSVSFDEIQLEQSVSATAYHSGYSASTLSLTYMKLPPAYLGCTGNDTDAADCANYATMCSEIDVGCSAYTPSNGDPVVDGIVDSTDSCPSECVGYDTFKQEATLYEPDGSFPEYFIPDSATTCSAASVGCDEFTNITTEGNEYFTYLRACLTPAQATANTGSDNEATFYTWEGSDTSGYQLKTWNLLESNMTSSSFTYPVSGGIDTAPESAPCSRWSAATASTSISCEDTSTTLSDDTANCTSHDDTITNPDCREFYDVSGVIHYRDWSKSVTVSDSCVTYRKTEIVGNTTADQQSNCENSGGAFDTATASCRYFGLSSESSVCSEAASGCRQYTGGRSANSRQAFLEYFEDGNDSNWDSASATGVTLSNESIAVDGHSLSSVSKTVWTYVGGNATCAVEDGCASTSTSSLGGTCTVANGETFCGTLTDQLYAEKTYTVSFWAKGTGTLKVGFDTAITFGTTLSATIDASFTGTTDISLDGTWHQYSYGPLDMNSTLYPSFGNGSSALVFVPTGTMYLDNVLLKEGEDEIDVIKNSWVTPASCDQTFEGTTSPQFMLGCQEYTDQNGDIADLKSFSSLCSDKKVGCAAYNETQESDATTAAVYGAECALLNESTTVATVATSCYYKSNGASSGATYDTTSPFLCTIGVGNTSCTFDMDWYVPATSLAGDTTTSHLSYTSSTVVSPADKDVFVVADSSHTCSSDVMGCMNVGLPVFSADHRSIESWTETYLMNTPADYSTTLCSQADLFCNAFVDSAQTTHYFKDPQSQTCEYRTGVTIDGTSYDGWFKTGVDEICATNVTADDSYVTDSSGAVTTTREVGSAQYLIGGSQSGIWRNGDENYAGWVGTCTSSNDMCTEFQDLADLENDQLYGDVNGKSYYYLNNEALDESSLPDSEQCNGQVSQKLGCALFNDNTNSAKTMSMTATYVASKHADVLFGGEPNGLVEPIDCSSSATSTITTSSGETVDLCAQRCQYSSGELYDISQASETVNILSVYDGSCYDVSDCRPLTSESGETVEAIGCADPSFPQIPDRLTNDANMVVKTNRDRQCAEWLSCSNQQTVWDERTNSYKNICYDVGLCTEYSGTGDASFCSAWKMDEPAITLTNDVYASRDVSWYGEDYSGMAIPDALPVDQLTQVNVNPPAGICTADSPDHAGDECSSDADCGGSGATANTRHTYCPDSTTDYRLAYIAGGCDASAAYGDSCTVGYCENTGSPCVDTTSCGALGGSCLVGTCYDVSSTVCTTDSQCPTESPTCQSGRCSARGTVDATIENYNSAGVSGACDEANNTTTGMTLYTSVNFAQGTCLENSCVLTPNGETFDSNNSEGKVCRGYPEPNSPFPRSVVTEWQNPYTGEYLSAADVTSGSGYGYRPISFVQNFDNVQTCAVAEDCECSYTKLEYDSAGTVRYRGSSVASADLKTSGICTSGSFINSQCSTNEQCNLSAEEGGTGDGKCTKPTRINSVIGMDGYCLERDSSTNLYGDRNLNACLSWLPIDQLAGSTDVYGKSSEAGFEVEAEYCGIGGQYSNVGTFLGCAEIRGVNGNEFAPDDVNEDNKAYCQLSMVCPKNFFAVGGYAKNNSTTDTSEAAELCTDGVNGCPYRCVPNNSVHSSTGERCVEPSDDVYSSLNPLKTTPYGDENFGFTLAYIVNYTDTPTILNDYSDCVYSGNPIDANEDIFRLHNYPTGDPANSTSEIAWSAAAIVLFTTTGILPSFPVSVPDNALGMVSGFPDSDPTYRLMDDSGNYTTSIDSISNLYTACSSLVQVSSDDSGDWNYAWTDRVANTASASFEGVRISSDLTYVSSTLPSNYGMSITPLAVADEVDPKPAVFPSCGDTHTSDTYFSPTTNTDMVCAYVDGDKETYAKDLLYPDATPQAREYFDWSDGTAQGSQSYSDGSSFGATSEVATNLGQLFAKPLNVYDWSSTGLETEGVYDSSTDLTVGGPALGSYGEPIAASAYSDSNFNWDVRAEEGSAPQVYAVDTRNCYNDYCEEDQLHGMTVNDQNEGEVTGDRFFRAYVKFFMAADKNQLPIRRLIMDWGDGKEPTGSSTDDNFYKNHRGLQPGTQTSICDTAPVGDTVVWGETAESCDPNYLTYSYIYTCNLASLTNTCTDADSNGVYDVFPCKSEDAKSCVYRPAVHVRDNWGFCGGTCTDTVYHDANNDSESCFADYDNITIHGLGTSPDDATSECSYGAYKQEDPTSGFDPWIYYDGTIVVTP